jgi:hypothetical protein
MVEETLPTPKHVPIYSPPGRRRASAHVQDLVAERVA